MRYVIAVCFLAVAACSQQTSQQSGATPRAPSENAEKPEDEKKHVPGAAKGAEPKHEDTNAPTSQSSPLLSEYEKFTHWLIPKGQELSKADENKVAVKTKSDALKKEIATLTGQRIKWRVKISRVDLRERDGQELVELTPTETCHPYSSQKFLMVLQEVQATGVYQQSDFPFIRVKIGTCHRPGRTVEDTARILNVDPDTVRQMIRLGTLEGRLHQPGFRVQNEPWIASLRSGSEVQVEGKLASISFQRGSLPVPTYDFQVGIEEIQANQP